MPWSPPKTVNVKPSRFGPIRNLFAAYDYCEERGIGAYGGGQTELGQGRGQIQYLASIFHPDTPNDVAPGGYNDPEPGDQAGPPVQPARAGDRADRLPLGRLLRRRLDRLGFGRPNSRVSATLARAQPRRDKEPEMADKTFADALNEQIANEFAASQQYVGAAVYYDAETLPRLAAFFYRQALEEREHAMMMIQYLLDVGEEVHIPDIKSQETTYADGSAPVQMALEQEKRVSEEIFALFELARELKDYRAEQFLQWFVKEQVEEVALMGDLLNVVERSKENLLLAEDYIARESLGEESSDPTAPPARGRVGALAQSRFARSECRGPLDLAQPAGPFAHRLDAAELGDVLAQRCGRWGGQEAGGQRRLDDAGRRALLTR